MREKFTKWFAGGSIATAFIGSCCALPLLLMGLGVGGAGIATTLAPYRPYFILLTVLLLGVSFYFVYGKKSPACDDEVSCNPRRQKITKLMLWVAAAMALIFLIGPDLIARYLL